MKSSRQMLALTVAAALAAIAGAAQAQTVLRFNTWLPANHNV
jgi:hypothetical protein